MVNWGDLPGFDTLPLLYSETNSSYSIFRDNFTGVHNYAVSGVYPITMQTGYLSANVDNIPESENKILAITDTIRIFPQGHEYEYNYGVWLGSNQTTFQDIDGVVVLWPPQAFTFEIDYCKMQIVPYPAPGFQYPEAPNGIYIENHQLFSNKLIWDLPVTPGTYALAFHPGLYLLNIQIGDHIVSKKIFVE